MATGTGTNRKISASSARAHTRKPKSNSHSRISGIFKKLLLVFFVGFLAWAYQAIKPPPPKICGSKDGHPVTAPRIQLKDGRHLAYKEFGVPKDNAKHKIVFVHALDTCRHDVSAITSGLSPDFVESGGIYIVSFDRPGYGESDPNPAQTLRSISSDIEELADQLGLGSKFYVAGFSLGGQIVWTCLKHIPHRLAGAALIAHYWWKGIPSNLSAEAYKKQLLQDQWALRVAHYTPWLIYWWNTQKLFPCMSIIARSTKVLSQQDVELMPKIHFLKQETAAQVRQQGDYESIHRDLAFAFGKWEFDPTELRNPFAEGSGSVDILVPATLQREINYHEVRGAGHKFLYADGIADSIIQALVS
ncbi:uncharacterized protein LOC121787966 [Salvia splendens]|uniref:uncharacterized protein LOC121787966 n=1 Tax=Salvia splendens TaxID=180675 RepID=UPI001C276FCD|nr:uncharacterized protein LOC121787966 [Salvia splendens]XP_042042751.1 uncharacterized protein LOC121787966 [Salvia splendens]